VHHVKGSHHSLRHPEWPDLRVVVPVHRRDLAPGTLRSIVKQCQLTEEEFIELL
jgi:predicted RNA binding protein YcfA (HicA-like mRNA interferase family)